MIYRDFKFTKYSPPIIVGKKRPKIKKILLSIDAKQLAALFKLKPRTISNQEAIRQLVNHFILEKEYHG